MKILQKAIIVYALIDTDQNMGDRDKLKKVGI